MATNTTTIKFTGQFDTTQITKGLQDIKKQMSNSHIGEDLRKQLETALNKVEVNIPALEKMSAKGEFNFKEIQNYQKILVEVSKDMNNLLDLANKADFTKAFSSADTEKLKQFEKQLSDVENKIKSTKKEIIKSFEESEKSNGRGGNRTLNGVIEQLISVPPDKIEDKLNEIIKEAEKQTYNAREELQNIFKDAKYAHGGDNAVEFLFGKDSGVTIADKKKGEIKDTFNAIRKEIQAFNENTPTKEVEETLKKLIDLVNSENLLNTEGKQSVLGNLLPQDVLDRLKDLANHVPELKEILGKENLKILDETEAEKIRLTAEQTKFLEDRLKELVEAKKITVDQANLITDSLNKQEGEVKELGDQYKKQQAQVEALNATFGGLARRIENSISALAVFNKSTQIIRNAIKSVEDLDAAFTQIAIVSEQSSEQAWKMFDSFNSLAKQYSITTKDLAEGAKLFYQQGLNAADTMKMVEASTVSAALGEVTMTEAANTLTAAIQGYNESAAVAMDYTDKIAMVGAVSAADFNELSAAMEKTASSAYTAGIDFDHLLGYLGKMIEVTREAPANLGTAMKTIIARFEDMKKDPLAILEDGVTANKVEAALATIGIALRDTAGEFRPLQDVFDELGMKWQSLTRNQQAYIATVAAGSRQQSRFLAMMNNYDRTLDLITESQNSAGAAAQQYETYQDSIAAAQARLTASWENFYSKIVDNSAIKIVINGLSSLVDALSKVPPAITAIGAAFGALELQGFIRGNGKNLLNNIFGKFVTKDDGTIEKAGENIIHRIFDGMTNALKDKSFEDFKEMTDLSKSFPKMGENIEKGLGKVPGALSKVGSSFASVGKLIGGFIAANWQIIGIATLVAGAIYLINRALTANKRKYEESVSAIKKYNEEANELKDKTNSAEELFDKYDELVNKINRTNEEQNELNSTIKSISEIYQDAIHYVDEYGNEHLENASILKEEIELEKDLAKQKTRNALEERKNLLESDRKNWKKEDFSEIGFSTPQIDKYFNNQETLKYYKDNIGINLLDATTMSMIESLSEFESSSKPDYSKLIRELNQVVKYSQINLNLLDESTEDVNKILKYYNDINSQIPSLGISLDDVEQTINNINKESEDTIKTYKKDIIDILNEVKNKYNLGMIPTLSEDADDNAILKNFEAIKNYNFGELANKLEKEQEDLIKRLQKDNNIKLSFLDLVYSEKAGVAIAQRSIATQLQSYLSELSNEAYEILEKRFDENGLTGFIQEAITKISPDNVIQVKNLMEQIFDLSTSEEKLGQIYEQLGNYCSEEFINGLKEARVEQQRQIRENAIEALKNLFGENINIDNIDENLTVSEANALTTAGSLVKEKGRYGNYGLKESQQISPYIEQLQKLEEDTIKNGGYAIYEEQRDAILADAKEKLGSNGTLIEMIESFADDSSEVIMEAAQNKIFDNAQTKIQQFTSDYKKAMDAAFSGDSTKLTDTNLTSSDAGVYVDPESGELMVSFVRTLADLEAERAVILTEIDKAYKEVDKELNNLNNKTEELTTEEERRKNQLERQKFILEQQNKIISENMALDNAQAGWGVSIKLAKQYQSELSTINSVEKKLQEQSFLDVSDMEEVYNILPRFAAEFEETEKGIYTIQESSIQNIKEQIKSKYEYELALQKDQAIREYEAAKAEYEALLKSTGDENRIKDALNDENFLRMEKEVKAEKEKNDEILDKDKKLATASGEIASNTANNLVTVIRQALVQIGKDFKDFIDNKGNVNWTGLFTEIQSQLDADKIVADFDIEFNADSFKKKAEEENLLDAAIDNAKARMEAAYAKIKSIKPIDVPQIEKMKDDLKDVSKGAKETDKALEALAKAIKECTDALEDLDKLLIDIRRDFDDITADYNPFTDLFEAWEAEWDYYYNIKNLLNQLEVQANYIDNVISSDYSTAQDKLAAYDAKVGNITSKLAANDAYILTLRAGIAQKAKEFEEEFNEYYNVDHRMGGWQIFQRDTTLNQWEENINDVKKYSFELSKLINQQENELSLLEVTEEALEQERSAYESILSTVDSLVDSLKNNEDITVDLTSLENTKVQLQAAIDKDSVEEVKKQIRDLNDYIQELNWQLDLNDNVVEQGLEDAYDRMEDGLDHIQELIDTLNDKLAEQQELLQDLSEIYDYYIDTAISTQQDLYNAIVEQYQDEINKKKEQYDYLKQLDKDYLQSVKDNINKERQAREDANKQKSYQQNLQRAQLLQQDTSGAYRKELASLNKELESQRQGLYDDLVDKQVEALEKEIEKRHELYDMEVAALQERLAYMQENAILLWEMVNDIVSNGADSMMATLENTTDYINQNELAKEKQRRQWEINTQTTYKGVIEGEIESLNQRIAKGKEYIDSLSEIRNAIDLSTQTYIMSKDILEDEAGKMQMVMDNYMQVWTTMTSDLTGYHSNWKITVETLQKAMEKNIQALDDMGNEGGSIYLLNEKLRNVANEMYNSFLEERRAFKDAIQNGLNSIQAEIVASAKRAGDAIQNAANSIQVNPNKDNGSSNTSSGGTGITPAQSTNPTAPSGGSTPKKYKISFQATGIDLSTGETQGWSKTLDGFSSEQEAINAANSFINNWLTEENLVLKKRSALTPVAYKQGGFADFTGLAWLDGTKSKPEAVLNPKQTRLFQSMVSSLERTAANNSNINSVLGSSYNIGDINTSINVEKLDNETDIDKVAKQVENRIMKSIHNRVVLSVV